MKEWGKYLLVRFIHGLNNISHMLEYALHSQIIVINAKGIMKKHDK